MDRLSILTQNTLNVIQFFLDEESVANLGVTNRKLKASVNNNLRHRVIEISKCWVHFITQVNKLITDQSKQLTFECFIFDKERNQFPSSIPELKLWIQKINDKTITKLSLQEFEKLEALANIPLPPHAVNLAQKSIHRKIDQVDAVAPSSKEHEAAITHTSPLSAQMLNYLKLPSMLLINLTV